MSLRLRLVLLVLAVVVPAAAASLWAVDDIYERERQSLQQRLQQTTRALAQVVDRELGQRALVARILAVSPYLDDAPVLSPLDQQRFYQQAVRATEGTRGSVVLSSREGQVLDTARPLGAPLPVPAPGDPPLQRFIDGDGGLTPLLPSRTAGQQVATFQMPVRRNGQVVMNVGVTVQPQELQQIVDDQRLPERWTAAVIDTQATLVARRPLRFIGGKATADMTSQLQHGDEGYFESVSLDGLRTVAFFSKSPSYGWAFVIAVPRDEFGASVRRSMGKALAAIALIALLASATTVWVWRGIVRPIGSLRDSAGDLGRGEPVLHRPTGLRECDDVSRALADASGKILNAQHELEQEVASAVEQTREAQQRLSRGQRIEALGRLTGGVAHDFNNLLAVIGNNAFLLKRVMTDERAAPRLAAIARAVEVGSRLTQHLLRFSRHQPVKPETIDLASYLPAALELLRTVVGSTVELRATVQPGVAALHVDSAELELALINLALNARDAMADGGELHLQARDARADELAAFALSVERQGAAYVLIAVSDSGPGIPESVAERVFEPFFTTKEVGKGTGLGLSQVYGFCTQAGGTARVQPRRPDDGAAAAGSRAGTTIEMLLPAAAVPPSVAEPPLVAAAPVSRKRLLLVEDNEALGDVTELLLSELGYQVQRASDVDAALQVIADGPVDIVLSDVVMPGERNGIDLARELRARPGAPPVVLISGYTATLPGALEFDVLQKPCPPDVLSAALQRGLAAAATAGSIAERERAAGPSRT